MYIAITFVLFNDNQCQESLHCYHFYIVQRHPMSGKCTLLLLLYCAQTSKVRKVYIAITFILRKDIQCQESVHCCYFRIVHRHLKSRKCALVLPLYCAQTSNVRKHYIAIFFFFFFFLLWKDKQIPT